MERRPSWICFYWAVNAQDGNILVRCTGWPRSYCKYMLQITQPSQYGYEKLQYRFAITSGSPSTLLAYVHKWIQVALKDIILDKSDTHRLAHMYVYCVYIKKNTCSHIWALSKINWNSFHSKRSWNPPKKYENICQFMFILLWTLS